MEIALRILGHTLLLQKSNCFLLFLFARLLAKYLEQLVTLLWQKQYGSQLLQERSELCVFLLQLLNLVVFFI